MNTSATVDNATVSALLKELRTRLAGRGLSAEINATSWSLLAQNPSNAHLSQRVSLAADPAGTLAWFWSWEDGGNLQHERICPGPDVTEVATRLSRVVSLPGAAASSQP